jgi:hypothetical protein
LLIRVRNGRGGAVMRRFLRDRSEGNEGKAKKSYEEGWTD